MTHDTASTQEAPVVQPADQLVGFLQELLRPAPAPEQAPRGRGRPRDLSSDHLWLALLIAVLRGYRSFAGVWRLITWSGVGRFRLLDLTRDAVRKRLLHSDRAGLHELLGRVSEVMRFKHKMKGPGD